jgi:hypothetical protein
MSGSLGLPRFPEQVVLLWARVELSGFLARFFSERDQPFFQGSSLLETTPLGHGAARFLEWAGTQPAFSSTIVATGFAVMTMTPQKQAGFSTPPN